MNYPIETTGAPGQTMYAVVHHPDGRVWNTLTSAWEAFTPANWSLYAVALVEQGSSGYYRGVFPTAIADVLTTEAIYSQAGGSPAMTDAPAVGIGQSQGVSLTAVRGDTDSVTNFLLNLGTMRRGAAIAGTLSTTQMTTDLTESLTDLFQGRVLIFTTGALAKRAAYVTAYDGVLKKLTFGSVGQAPVAGDEFIIL
jgi:hypothetical protein